MITAAGLLTFLQVQGYFVLFLIVMAEGTISTYVAAFIASLGVFNVFIVFGVAVLGNFVGDIMWYWIGKRWGKKVIANYFHSRLKGGKLKKLELFIKKNPGRSIVFVKVSPIIPIPGIILIGSLEVPMKKFMFYSFITGIIYSGVFTLLGFYSGKAFSAISVYVENSALIIGAALLVGVGLWLLFRFISGRLAVKVEEGNLKPGQRIK